MMNRSAVNLMVLILRRERYQYKLPRAYILGLVGVYTGLFREPRTSSVLPATHEPENANNGGTQAERRTINYGEWRTRLLCRAGKINIDYRDRTRSD